MLVHGLEKKSVRYWYTIVYPNTKKKKKMFEFCFEIFNKVRFCDCLDKHETDTQLKNLNFHSDNFEEEK